MKRLIFILAAFLSGSLLLAEPAWQAAISKHHTLAQKDDSFQHAFARMLEIEKTLSGNDLLIFKIYSVFESSEKSHDLPWDLPDVADPDLPVEQWNRARFERFINNRIAELLSEKDALLNIPWCDFDSGHSFFPTRYDTNPAIAERYHPTLYDWLCDFLLKPYNTHRENTSFELPPLFEAWRVSAEQRGLRLLQVSAAISRITYQRRNEKLSREAGAKALLALLPQTDEAKALIITEWCDLFKDEEEHYAELAEKLTAFDNTPLSESLRKRINNLLGHLRRKELEVTCETIWPVFPATIKVKSRNVPELNVEIFKTTVRSLYDSDLLESEQAPDARIAAWSEKTTQGKAHTATETEVRCMDPLPPGVYILRIEASGEKEINQVFAFTVAKIRLANINTSGYATPQSTEFYVTDAISGLPIEGARVEMITKNKSGKVLESGLTASDGSLRMLISDETDQREENAAIRASYGDSSIDTVCLDYNTKSSPPSISLVHWLFDRAVYRPGQTVYYACILAEKNEAEKSGTVLSEESGSFLVKFCTGGREQTISSVPFLSDKHGAFSGSFKLPENLPPSIVYFTIPLNQYPYSSTGEIRVEEYRRPTFEVTLGAFPKAAFGEPITLTGSAKMLNGAPVQNAPVKWETLMQEGTTVTDSNGNFTLTLTVPLPSESEDFEGIHTTFTASVTDHTGETREARQEFSIAYAPFVLKLDYNEWNEAEKPVIVSVTTKAIDGSPASIEGTLDFFTTIPSATISSYSQDSYCCAAHAAEAYQKFESKPRLTIPFKTVDGKIDVGEVLPPGLWYAQATVKDEKTGKIITKKTYSFRVLTGEQPYTGSEAFIFMAEDKSSYRVGETARFYWATGHKQAAVRIIILNNRGAIHAETYSASNSHIFEIPITEAMLGGFVLNAVMIKENRTYTARKRIEVPWERKLEVTALEIPKTVKPGTKQVWRVKTRPGAQVSATLYDAALDFITPHEWDDFYMFLPQNNYFGYDWFSGRDFAFNRKRGNGDQLFSMASSSTGVDEFYRESEKTSRAGGMFSRVRSDFRETAFFQASVEADSEGIATFSFTLPDSLTRWKFLAFAYTDDLYSGATSAEVQTIKDLMLTPNLPRFLREGDHCEIPVKLDNFGTTEQRGSITLDVSGYQGTFPSHEFTLAAGASTHFSWQVTPQIAGEMTFTFTARGTTDSDADQRAIPVLSNLIQAIDTQPFTLIGKPITLETSLAAHLASPTFTPESWNLELIDNPHQAVLDALLPQTEIAVKSSDRLFQAYAAYAIAGHLLQLDPKLADASPFFSEKILIERAGIALTTLKALTVKNEGWGWFDASCCAPFMTDTILIGYARLHQLGITEKWLNETVEEILKTRTTPASAYARTALGTPPEETTRWRAFVEEQLKEPTGLDVQERRLLALAAHRLGLSEHADREMVALRASLNESETWGAYWPRERRWWSGWRTPVESHVLGMEMLHEITNDRKTVHGATQWLLQHKRLNAWETPRSTAAALFGLLKTGTPSFTGHTPVRVSDAKAKALERRAFTGADITPDLARITLTPEHDGLAFGGVTLIYREALDKLAPTGDPEALTIEKQVYAKRGHMLLAPAQALEPGDETVVRLIIRAAQEMSYVLVTDARAAGNEPIDVRSGYRWSNGTGYYLTVRDAETRFYLEKLPRGTTILEYSGRIFNRGDFQSGIATVESLYAPAFNARTAATRIETAAPSPDSTPPKSERPTRKEANDFVEILL